MKNILIFAFLAASLMLGAAERMVYVARHCQAFSKGPEVIRPIAGDAGITPLGVRQAQLLGKRLKELNFSGEMIIEREISGPQQAEDIKRAVSYLKNILDSCNQTNQ